MSRSNKKDKLSALLHDSESRYKAWEQISTEYLIKENWFKFRRDKVLKSDGSIMPAYYVLEYSNWVTVFPVTTDGKIILVKQYRYGLGQWSIELPGGIMDPHEKDPAEAAKRELLEETGFICKALLQTAVVAPNPATSNNLMYCFLATQCECAQAQQLDENEELIVMFVTMKELKEMIKSNQIIQSLHLTTMLYALQQLGEIKW